jgi:hypothetical protein
MVRLEMAPSLLDKGPSIADLKDKKPSKLLGAAAADTAPAIPPPFLMLMGFLLFYLSTTSAWEMSLSEEDPDPSFSHH